MTDKTESNINGSRERLVMQLEEQISTRTNIIITANSFLFVPFVSLITESTPVAGYLIWIPIILCSVGIFLNAFWYFPLSYRFLKGISLVNVSNLVAYFQITTKNKDETVSKNPHSLTLSIRLPLFS